MHPIIFKIPLFGGIPIFSYGLLVASAFLVGLLWVKYDARVRGEDPALAMDLVFYIIVAALIGSRVLYVLVNQSDRFLANPVTFFYIWEGGLVFYGGFIGAAIAVFLFIRHHKLSFSRYADICVPGVALGHCIGRLGCFMSGCCYGKVAHDHPWYAVVFPAAERGFAPTGVPLYPTQLMESAGALVIFAVLFLLRRRQRFNGQILASYLMIYALLRSTIEVFRGDIERGFVIDPYLSTSQFISIIIFALGAFLYIRHFCGAKHEN